MTSSPPGRRATMHVVYPTGGSVRDLQATVSWFPGSSAASIRRAVCQALGIPAIHAELLEFRDLDAGRRAFQVDDTAVANAFSGPEIRAEVALSPLAMPRHGILERILQAFGGRVEESVSARPGKLSAPRDLAQDLAVSDLPHDPAFQGQFVKLERVLSHLANERTWLAWLRAGLTLLSTAFTLWQLYDAVSGKIHPVLRKALYGLALGYLVIIPLTVVVGWFRFERTKHILNLSSSLVRDYFGNIGVAVQATLLGAIFLLTVGCYWGLGFYYFGTSRR